MSNKDKNLTEFDTDPTSELELPTWRHSKTAVEHTGFEIDAHTASLQQPVKPASGHASARSSEYELEQKRALIKGLEAERKTQQDMIRDLNTRQDALLIEVAELRQDLSASDELLSGENAEKHELLKQHEELKAELDRLQAAESVSKDSISELSTRLEHTESTLAERVQELTELQTLLKKNAGDRPAEAASPALIAAFRHEIRDLEQRLLISDRLHDQTRQALQDSAEAADYLSRQNSQLHRDLSAQVSVIEDQKSALTRLEAVERDLLARLANIEADHAEEIRVMRFELTEADQTINQHELINQQLASDIVENRSLKNRLETKLSDVDAAAKNTITELENQLANIKQHNDELKSQLRSKNESIHCLLNELGEHRTVTDEPNAAAVDDTGETPAIAVHEHDPSEQVTRYLVGVVDGQEVRFPLFKPRLTIGRTQANDLQLSPEFISRRHAVIVTEAGKTRIIDWGSRNGIKVNNTAVSEHFLESGDIVSVGTFDFVYEERRRH